MSTDRIGNRWGNYCKLYYLAAYLFAFLAATRYRIKNVLKKHERDNDNSDRIELKRVSEKLIQEESQVCAC